MRQKKLLRSVKGITKSGSHCKMRQKIITKCYKYYKLWQEVIKSVTSMAKCDNCYRVSRDTVSSRKISSELLSRAMT